MATKSTSVVWRVRLLREARTASAYQRRYTCRPEFMKFSHPHGARRCARASRTWANMELRTLNDRCADFGNFFAFTQDTTRPRWHPALLMQPEISGCMGRCPSNFFRPLFCRRSADHPGCPHGVVAIAEHLRFLYQLRLNAFHCVIQGSRVASFMNDLKFRWTILEYAHQIGFSRTYSSTPTLARLNDGRSFSTEPCARSLR